MVYQRIYCIDAWSYGALMLHLIIDNHFTLTELSICNPEEL